jgi:hypothetical protein
MATGAVRPGLRLRVDELGRWSPVPRPHPGCSGATIGVPSALGSGSGPGAVALSGLASTCWTPSLPVSSPRVSCRRRSPPRILLLMKKATNAHLACAWAVVAVDGRMILALDPAAGSMGWRRPRYRKTDVDDWLARRAEERENGEPVRIQYACTRRLHGFRSLVLTRTCALTCSYGRCRRSQDHASRL